MIRPDDGHEQFFGFTAPIVPATGLRMKRVVSAPLRNFHSFRPMPEQVAGFSTHPSTRPPEDRRPALRRIEVPLDLKLDRLHLTIQAAMGWTNGPTVTPLKPAPAA